MPFWGDFKTYPLPDMLQWLDEGRRSGVLFLEATLRRRLRIYRGTLTGYGTDRLVESTAPLAVSYGLVDEDRAATAVRKVGEHLEAWIAESKVDRDALRLLLTEESTDVIFDAISVPDGAFEFQADEAYEDETWIPIEVEVRALLLEGMRHLDERPQVERLFGTDSARPRLGRPLDRSILRMRDRRILDHVDRGESVGEIRWALKASSQAIGRRLFDLARSGHVLPPSGETVGPDPIGKLIEQGLVLLRERQFDEVAHVFQSLLGMDQGDRRVREFLQHIEREHVGEMYRTFSPLGVPSLAATGAELARLPLQPEDRTVLDLLDGRRDVAKVVAMSPLRELNTLRSLRKLEQSGAIRIQRP